MRAAFELGELFARVRVGETKKLEKQRRRVKRYGWLYRTFGEIWWLIYKREGEKLLDMMATESERIGGK